MMLFWRHYPGARRSLAALLLMLTPGCYNWNTVQAPSPESFADPKPDRAQVTLISTGETIQLNRPSLVTDSLVGWKDRRTRVAIPLAGISSVAIRRVDQGTTILLVGVVTVAVVAAIVAASQALESTFESDWFNPSGPFPHPH